MRYALFLAAVEIKIERRSARGAHAPRCPRPAPCQPKTAHRGVVRRRGRFRPRPWCASHWHCRRARGCPVRPCVGPAALGNALGSSLAENDWSGGNSNASQQDLSPGTAPISIADANPEIAALPMPTSDQWAALASSVDLGTGAASTPNFNVGGFAGSGSSFSIPSLTLGSDVTAGAAELDLLASGPSAAAAPAGNFTEGGFVSGQNPLGQSFPVLPPSGSGFSISSLLGISSAEAAPTGAQQYIQPNPISPVPETSWLDTPMVTPVGLDDFGGQVDNIITPRESIYTGGYVGAGAASLLTGSLAADVAGAALVDTAFEGTFWGAAAVGGAGGFTGDLTNQLLQNGASLLNPDWGKSGLDFTELGFSTGVGAGLGVVLPVGAKYLAGFFGPNLAPVADNMGEIAAETSTLDPLANANRAIESLTEGSDTAPLVGPSTQAAGLPPSGISQLSTLKAVSPGANGYINMQTTESVGGYINYSDLNAEQQAMVNDITTTGDVGGNKTEELINSIADKEGLNSLDGIKYGSNNGFDHVFQNPTDGTTYILDSKPFVPGEVNSGPTSVTYGSFSLEPNAAGNFTQLSDDWVDTVLGKLNPSSPGAQAVSQAIDSGTLVKGVIGVNPATGDVVIVRVK